MSSEKITSPEPLEFDGLTAVVTGTAQGIGQAIAAELGSAGATVIGVDRDTVDLSNSAEAADFFRSLPRVDILVNSAGGVVGQTHTPLDELSDDAGTPFSTPTSRPCSTARALPPST